MECPRRGGWFDRDALRRGLLVGRDPRGQDHVVVPAIDARPAKADVRIAGAIGLSPAGVTTKVDVPAESTEEEYYQACHAARVWMQARPKTGESQFEPYLAMVQTSPTATAGSWNTRWADLTPARQAAVITAARAAANDECD
ncbi:hypothetical protein MSTO_51030 [Mycobacterium stomatepiae]|uniref:Lipoprotein LpqV n=1 Tax=Mycobacterium stomatepiae TaxID=470076 RepID=A0A7I7QF25_9MYCO|nr:lipoprotein LpqV [Mycobacterium stomatepiae]BBY24898.1 hypothetical protein MSTO_51030 [Mycobacterium stomatepiae]